MSVVGTVVELVKQYNFSLAPGVSDFILQILLRLRITLDKLLHKNILSNARLSQSSYITKNSISAGILTCFPSLYAVKA